MKLDLFLIGMLAAVALAFAAPGLGADSGPLHMGLVTNLGVGMVFFLHGAALAPSALKAGAANWRLHLFVQTSTYVLFPLVGLTVFFGSPGVLAPEVRLGFFYLCVLSSTISSSVAMTSLAKGNVSGAVFDATLSGLIGMLLTPLLLGLVHVAGAARLPILPAIEGIVLKLLVPFVAGQVLRFLIRPILERNRALVSRADRLVILLIVYGAFCNSSAGGLWSRYSLAVVLEILAMVGALLVLVLTVTTLASRALGFSRADKVAAVFCGSKKSLANGAPMAKVLFGASPALGMIMLPLLLYHQLQLIVCGVLARRYAAQAELETPFVRAKYPLPDPTPAE